MLKNVTLSADKNLIEQARRRAEAKNTTLNKEVVPPSIRKIYIPVT
jgi:hypothetical protein